jgi:hypothetical protein
MTDHRKINLSLPADYISKPADKVRDWLRANTNSLRAMGETQIIQRVRTALGSEITRLNDADIAVLVKEWAREKGIQLPGPPAGAGPSESEIVARLKKVLGAIPTSIDYKWNNGVATISVSGATVKLNAGKAQYSVSGSWGGNLEFKTQAQGVAFTASMSEKEWRLSLAYGELAPNLSELETVFKKGEAALRGALGDLDKVDWRNPSKTKQVFSPYLDPVKSAVDAVSKSAKQRPGAVSIGGWVGGGPSGGVGGGVQLTIVF